MAVPGFEQSAAAVDTTHRIKDGLVVRADIVHHHDARHVWGKAVPYPLLSQGSSRPLQQRQETGGILHLLLRVVVVDGAMCLLMPGVTSLRVPTPQQLEDQHFTGAGRHRGGSYLTLVIAACNPHLLH